MPLEQETRTILAILDRSSRRRVALAEALERIITESPCPRARQLAHAALAADAAAVQEGRRAAAERRTAERHEAAA